MRVIAGKARGRKLKAPPGLSVRPTSDKVKGAVFSALAHYGPLVSFLDLFAGSGAMGIEAWSRGAMRVVFVEQDRKAYRILQDNIKAVGCEGVEVFLADWQQQLASLTGQRFTVIYADPPFDAGLYPIILQTIAGSGLLEPGGILSLEHPQRLQLDYGDEWTLLRTKRYGETKVTFLTPW